MFKNFFRKVRKTLKDVGPMLGAGAGMMLGPGWGAGIGALLGQYGGKEGVMKGAGLGALGGFGKQYLGKTGMFAPKGVPTGAMTNVAGSIPGPIQGILNTQGKQIGAIPKATQGMSMMDKLKGWGSNLYDAEEKEMTGLGKLLGGLGSSLGPGLMTYLALKGDVPEQPDQKAYRSPVDDYYAARARGEDPNPADFGLAPTPQERMVSETMYDETTDSYKNSGGLAGLQGGGMPYDETEQFSEEIVQTPTGMEELWQLRDQVNMPRSMRSETIGGVVGLALGGEPMFPRKRGAIHGPGGPKEDKIPAMLSDGEFVMTAKAVDNAGGPHEMYNLMNRLDPDSSRKPKGIA
tara:strand:- start:602 stop:1645 length:1044 start_codon:yes stop_codon:yes gene_type:complete